jgi:hypothetical protein
VNPRLLTQFLRAGPYSVTIDKTTTQYNGFSAKDNFTALFDSGSLASGQHTVAITNNESDAKKAFLDIDYVNNFLIASWYN